MTFGIIFSTVLADALPYKPWDSGYFMTGFREYVYFLSIH